MEKGIENKENNCYSRNNDYFCLICCNEINPLSKLSVGPPDLLDDIFFVLSNYLKWNTPGKEFQFNLEMFPFCDKCIRTVESVFDLNKQVHELLRRIDQHCAHIFAEILESREKSERILKCRNGKSSKIIRHVPKRKRSEPEACEFDVLKVLSYRDVILKRFTASVKLKQLENSPPPKEGVSEDIVKQNISSAKGRLSPNRKQDDKNLQNSKRHCRKRKTKKDIAGRRMNFFVQIKPNLYVYANKFRARKKGDDFECLSCLSILRNRKAAIDHLRRCHLKESILRCGTCDKGFVGQSYLDRHEKLHRFKKHYKCQRCGINFLANSKLEFHMREEHGEKQSDMDAENQGSSGALSKKSCAREIEPGNEFSRPINEIEDVLGTRDEVENNFGVSERGFVADSSLEAVMCDDGEPEEIKIEADDDFSPPNSPSKEMDRVSGSDDKVAISLVGKGLSDISSESEEKLESNGEDCQPPYVKLSDESDRNSQTKSQKKCLTSFTGRSSQRQSLRLQKSCTNSYSYSKDPYATSDPVRKPGELLADPVLDNRTCVEYEREEIVECENSELTSNNTTANVSQHLEKNDLDESDQDDDYHPSTSDSSEESDDDKNEVISDRSKGTRGMSSTARAGPKDKYKCNWDIGENRIRTIGANRFIFNESIPFERNNDKTWTCGNCGRHYPREVSMKRHLLSNCRLQPNHRFKLEELPGNTFKYAGKIFQMFGEDNFKCTDCEHVATTKVKAMGHILNDHVYTKKTRVTIQVLSDNKLIYRGFVIEKSENQFKCSTCSHVTESQADILRHIRMNHTRQSDRDHNSHTIELENSTKTMNISQHLGKKGLEDTHQNDDYHPSISDSSEESDGGKNEVISDRSKGTRGMSSTEGAAPKDKYVCNWDIGENRIRKIDANHFVFNESIPFERNNDKTWTCGNCGRHYPRQNAMKNHLLSNCKLQPNHRFKLEELPGNTFKYAGKIFQMFGEDNFKCTDCEHVATTKVKAMGHILTNHVYTKKTRVTIQVLSDNKFIFRGFLIEKSENQFKCSTCSHVTESQADILRHIRRNHSRQPTRGNNSLIIEIGKNKFQYRDSYQYEVADNGLYKCLTCGSGGHQKNTIIRHISECHIINRNSFVETSPNNFLFYGKFEAVQEEGKFRCVECAATKSTKDKIKNHIRTIHLNKTKFTCDLCDGKGFSSPHLLEEHKRLHANDKPFMCDYCDQTFASSSRMRVHVKVKHFKIRNKLCPHCGKAFGSNNELETHLTIHTGLISRYHFMCEKCGKTVENRHMKYHMATHGPPQFKCPECNKAFHGEQTLKRHVGSHRGTYKVQCQLCGKCYESAKSLEYHNWRCHSEHTAELDKKKRKIINKPGAGPHKCDVCGRGFYEKRKRELHKIRYHSELTAELDRQLKEKLCRRRKKVIPDVESSEPNQSD